MLAIAGMALVALWIASRRYAGIHHDASLYMLQALHALEPERFRTDLFLAYGSQDGFSVFTAIYAPLVQHAGPALAHAVVVVLGQALWLAGLLLLLRAIFPDPRQWLLAAAGVAVLSPYYGSHQIFSYAEAFATPRLLAEALVLVSLAALVSRRLAIAILSLGVAGLLHPLMALPGIMVVATLLVWERPRLAFGFAATAMLLVLLAIMGIEPFARATQQMDPEWMSVVSVRSAYGFASHAGPFDLPFLVAPLAALAMAWNVAEARIRRLIACVILVAAGGMIATAIGAVHCTIC